MESETSSGDEAILLTITDRDGRHYPVEYFRYDTGPDFFVYDQQIRIGHAYCLTQQETLYLADLCISNAARIPGGQLHWLLGLRPRTRDYSGRGIGSALLQLVIQKARELGFHRISGEVMRSDPRYVPSLLDWYRHHGFDVITGEGKPNIIASLSMRLK